ncbi:hypothetical protein [Actinoplanes derwentensis]|uniref:Uncharacterized protein n=1 Tax=Actinoplanes derwentensis TaxID=113562 RepID=A0A1H1QM22_9ACTN|nr:hypothetical protein [Actinoplanes derwentensis]GID82105.1 hypothetical protein Ade03nite_10290 [Actinoplanes derwentensis]SDS24387.1 hypothetical protein SAMN04489716_0340 [Actinoplanes derwentensis]
MTINRGLLTAAAVPLLFLLGACARPGAADEAGSSTPVTESTTADPDSIALRVEYRGGFVPAETIPGRIPRFSVYADGRALSEGPVTAIYPGPALPNLQEIKLSAAQVKELTDGALAAGVKSGGDFGTPNVADTPSTRIVVATAGGEQTVEVMALNEANPDDKSLTAAQHAARKKLTEFLASVDRLFAETASPASKPYQPTRLAVLAQPYQDTGDGAGGATVAWPAAALPGAALNEQLKINCVTVEGTELEAVWKLAGTANARTPWESAGKKWQIIFRPLLPEETGCDSLKRQA